MFAIYQFLWIVVVMTRPQCNICHLKFELNCVCILMYENFTLLLALTVYLMHIESIHHNWMHTRVHCVRVFVGKLFWHALAAVLCGLSHGSNSRRSLSCAAQVPHRIIRCLRQVAYGHNMRALAHAHRNPQSVCVRSEISTRTERLSQLCMFTCYRQTASTWIAPCGAR